MATQTYVTGALSAEQRTMYIGTLITRLIPFLPLLGDAQKATITQHTGAVANWRRFDNISTLATTPLTEGTTPAGNALAMTSVSATLAQYGDFIALSDFLSMAGIDPVVVQTTEVMGEHAGRTIHRLMSTELSTGTTLRYANGRGSRGALLATDVFNVLELRKAVRDLGTANVMKFGDGTFHGAISSKQKFDVTSDTAYQVLLTYTDTSKLMANELCTMFSARLWETNDVPVFPTSGAGSLEVDVGLLWGPGAYGAVDLQGMAVNAINSETARGIEVLITPLEAVSKSDPLHQRAYVGWKVAFVAKVLDILRIIRIETGVTA